MRNMRNFDERQLLTRFATHVDRVKARVRRTRQLTDPGALRKMNCMGRAVRFHQLGDAQVLKLEELEDRSPGPGELRMRVEAIGVNRADIQFRRGEYIEPPGFPSRLGYEAAGVIEAIGRDTSGFSIGDKVSVLPAFSLNQYGTYGETAILPAHAVTRYPRGLDAATAAGLWMPYLTAYGGLCEQPGLGKDKWVLITAATGGVGAAAIQVCRAVGAKVIATTRHREKADKLRALGADHIIDSSREDLTTAVHAATGGHGADLIFDPIAGATVQSLADCAADGGIITLYGYFAGIATPLPLIPFLLKGLSFRSFSVFRLTGDADRLERAKRFISDGIERGQLTPAIDRTFAFNDIVRAHEYVEGNLQTGKVVISV
jgi:NADPH2:quinone reductase